jgi:hypothetical protein
MSIIPSDAAARPAADDPEVSDLLTATGLLVGYRALADAVHGRAAKAVPDVRTER